MITEPKTTPSKKSKTIKKKPILFEIVEPVVSSAPLPKKTRKKRLKRPVEFIIMEKEQPVAIEKNRYNEKLIALMETLSNLMMKQGEVFKARAYQKAQETIMTVEEDIVNPEQLSNLPGIGSTIMEKIKEYFTTGTLKLIEREKNNPLLILGDIYGVGPKKAQELIKAGIVSIEQLKENPTVLNEVQKIGLKYYEDIQKKIPRKEIQEYETIFEKAFQQVQTKGEYSAFEIVGSYRRGALQSGDIDVIITSSSNKIYKDFIDLLQKEKVIIEVLSRGASKCLVITKLPFDLAVARRVDFLYTSPAEYPFALLYFTGSKIFNTVMRHYALQQGYTFNEHGMYKVEAKKKTEPVCIGFPNEKAIFDFLHLQYKEPSERIDGRAVKPIEKVEEKTTLDVANKKKLIEKPMETKISKDLETKINKDSKKKISKNKTIKKTPKKEKEEIQEWIHSFQKMGLPVLEHLSETQLSSIIQAANQAYYNQSPLFTDNEYDIVKEYAETKFPNNPIIQEIGTPVERNKVKLPYEMASMDKIKPDTNALAQWTAKYIGPYVLSCKLDGVSALYRIKDGKAALYTRGNGKIGQDISHFIPYLHLPSTQDMTIRGELMISKLDFETHLKTQFANPRNFVSGLINQKQVDKNIQYIHFIAYEVIEPVLRPSEQMTFLKNIPIETVLYETTDTITNESLSELLVKWRKDYIYEIDGIIVSDDKIYPRKSGNPEHAFAFKMVLSDQMAEAKVVDVLWTPSKDGYLKPRVRIEPIHLGGVVIEYATGFNGAFIEQHKIGVGAVIQIIRSGDVIPHIQSVVSPAEKAKMPLVPYIWNASHVDVLLEDIHSDPLVKEKQITRFFKGLGVEGLSSGNIHRLFQAGWDTLPKIIHLTKEDFLKIDGFKEKLSNKIYTEIQEKLKQASLVDLMIHSNFFGRGISDKKIEAIMQELPDLLVSKEYKTKQEKIKRIQEVKGMAQKTAEVFVEGIEPFLAFLQEAGLDNKLTTSTTSFTGSIPTSIPSSDHPLYKKNIVFTGIRDKQIIDFLKSVGANLAYSVNKNTFLVIAKSKEGDTGKTMEAQKLNIPILLPSEFIETYISP